MVDDALVIVLAGGAGERLYPLTQDRAKPAVYFGGPYRIIDFVLSNCINSGLRRVFIATQYKSLSLNRHIRMGWTIVSEELGEFIEILPPQKRVGEHWYLGTADAVYQNFYSILREHPRQVIVLAGDHVYKMDYFKMLRFHQEQRADVTLATIEVPMEESKRFGIVRVDEHDRVVGEVGERGTQHMRCAYRVDGVRVQPRRDVCFLDQRERHHGAGEYHRVEPAELRSHLVDDSLDHARIGDV